MAGLLDFVATPEGQGLLSAAFGGLAGARRGQPLNSIGRAGLAGLAGYSQAQDRQTQEAENEVQRKYREMQMQGMETQLAQQKAQQAWKANLPQVMQQAQPTYGAGDEGPTMTPGNPQALQSYLMRPESPFADKILEQRLIPKSPEYKVVGTSLVQVGPGGVQEAYRAPEKPEAAPSAVREYEYARNQGYKGSFQQFQTDLKRAGAANTNVVLKQEGEEAKTVGKFFGDAYANIQQAGFSAQSKVNRYNRLGQLLDGVNTGKFAGAGLEVAKAASSLGFNIDPNMANKEAAQALSGEIALELRNPSGGAGMPGAMSDADRQFLTNMVPGLATTPDGRKLMLTTAEQLAKRDMDVARMAREYRKRNGTINEGFYDELSRYSEANPLFKGMSAPATQGGANGGWSAKRKN